MVETLPENGGSLGAQVSGNDVKRKGVEGFVENINIFTTTLRIMDNVKQILPNGNSWHPKIKNYTLPGLRYVDSDYSMYYYDNMDKALKIIKDMVTRYENILKEPECP